MDLMLAAFIFIMDCLIVTFSVLYALRVGRQARREALKLRDEAIEQARVIRTDLINKIDTLHIPTTAEIIAAIPEYPEIDTEAIKADLRESLTKSLGGYMGNVQKDMNAVKETVDKAIERLNTGQPGAESPDMLTRLMPKLLDKFL